MFFSLVKSRLNLSSPLKRLHSTKVVVEPLKTLVLSHHSNGRFTNLLRNVVALPSVLLAASHNLTTTIPPNDDSVSSHVLFDRMSQEILSGQFEVDSHCVQLGGGGGAKGETLVLPDLKLKVFIEAIRMTLEAVYDDWFTTFSYGGRVGMGRHTAIRYLENSVENPSWWFTVCFDHRVELNVDKLCSFIAEKIDDAGLVDVVRRLFRCGVLRIELGGFWLGRGFPQECGLCPILINIYFNGFDREIQDMRLMMKRENPRLGGKGVGELANSFYKPVRIYAVRYFDEILMITSGSKELVMDLKSKVMRILEEKLELKVDKVSTAIHSAVTEKIDFLGMELQAVPPSVLRPPMSEKAIRARKKYARQKEVRTQELKNARERLRRKLGMKIFSHVFKKSKRGNAFRFDFHIENEVRQIFSTWADEVAQEFMESVEDRSTWHRMLTSGDFLSLRHIREQLPPELVDSYDNFQEQVHKHLSPVKARKAVEEKERRIEEDEEQRYAKRTVEDLTKLCMKVSAPIELIQKAVKMVRFTNLMGRPRPISSLLAMEDADIVKWYAGIGRRWLDFYCCCHNFKKVKTIVSYHLRFSCILTLAEKHEATKLQAIKHYTKDLKICDMDGKEEFYFPSEREVRMMGDKGLSDPKPVDGTLSLALIRMAVDERSHSCIGHFCNRTDTILYRVNLLQNILNVNPLDSHDWVQGMGAIHGSLNRKCLPLCLYHASDLYMGRITLQDIDCTRFVELD